MAANNLVNLQRFSSFAYTGLTEIEKQQVELFNTATRGALVLRSGDNQGDYSDTVRYGTIASLVRRRDAYSSGAVVAKDIAHVLETSVKVAGAAGPVTIDSHFFTWIQRAPEEAGAFLGQQLAIASMQDKLNTALTALYAALAQQSTANTYDYTGTGDVCLAAMNTAASKFGDRASDIACWVMHSKSRHDMIGQAITNTGTLFSFGNINVTSDGLGRPIIVTDSSALTYTSSGTKYRTLGLVTGAAVVEDNPIDLRVNTVTSNGDENIGDSWQAQWTFNLGLRGFKWDKTNGGASPSAAALATGTNWDKSATSVKDTAGVLILST